MDSNVPTRSDILSDDFIFWTNTGDNLSGDVYKISIANLAAAVALVVPGISDGKILIGGTDDIAAACALSGDVTMTNLGVVTIGAKKVTAAKTALTEGKIFIGAAGGAAAEQTLSGDLTVTAAGVVTVANDAITDTKLADANVGSVRTATATADGTTTGTLTAGSQHVTVTSDSADKIIILPAPVVGTQIVLQNGATGYELRSSAPETIAINGGSGAAAESAIAANSTCFLTCVSATAWKGFFLDADSDVAKVEAAA